MGKTADRVLFWSEHRSGAGISRKITVWGAIGGREPVHTPVPPWRFFGIGGSIRPMDFAMRNMTRSAGRGNLGRTRPPAVCTHSSGGTFR